jgi:hypothetical protein
MKVMGIFEGKKLYTRSAFKGMWALAMNPVISRKEENTVTI